MATLAFALLELGTIGCPAGVGREDLILAARVAADEAFEFLMRWTRRSAGADEGGAEVCPAPHNNRRRSYSSSAASRG